MGKIRNGEPRTVVLLRLSRARVRQHLERLEGRGRGPTIEAHQVKVSDPSFGTQL